MYNYVLNVRRPDNGRIDIYRQKASNPMNAISLTQVEFQDRNKLRLPCENIVLVQQQDYIGRN